MKNVEQILTFVGDCFEQKIPKDAVLATFQNAIDALYDMAPQSGVKRAMGVILLGMKRQMEKSILSLKGSMTETTNP